MTDKSHATDVYLKTLETLCRTKPKTYWKRTEIYKCDTDNERSCIYAGIISVLGSNNIRPCTSFQVL